MKKLSSGQRRTLSEFFTNGAVAWFTVGIATPVLTGSRVEEIYFPFSIGVLFTILFLTFSLFIAEGGITS